MTVEVSLHAVQRFQQRIQFVGFREAERRVREDIAQAVTEGRSSKQPRKWFKDLVRGTQPPRTRFAWPETCDRVYIVKREAQAWVVLTVVAPGMAEAAA